jgi:hypothetical protein
MTHVSIIMPTYNRADTIKRAIRSVQKQTFTDWELIVVDDGSTDNTTALICSQDMLHCIERFWGNRRDDPEISKLLGFRQLDIARRALERCERTIALKYLKAARHDFPELRRARYLQWLITLIPGERFSCQVYIVFAKAVYILGMIRRNEISIGEALRKVTRHLFSAPFHSKGHQGVNI